MPATKRYGKPMTGDLALIALTEPPDHHLWGNLMHRLHAAGYIVPIDWTTSHRPTSNSSGVRVRVGTTSTVTAVAA